MGERTSRQHRAGSTVNARERPIRAPSTITTAKRDRSHGTSPSDEIEVRAAAIRRNAEAAILDELPVDVVLMAIVGLAGWISTWSKALR